MKQVVSLVIEHQHTTVANTLSLFWCKFFGGRGVIGHGALVARVEPPLNNSVAGGLVGVLVVPSNRL